MRLRREQRYEEWLHDITTAARKFKEYLRLNVIRPRAYAHPEYVLIVRFDHYNHLKKRMESDIRRKWIERLQPLLQKPETVLDFV